MPETLVACKSCENPISKKASACPSCGRRRRGEGTVALQIIVLLVLIALLVWFFIEVFANVAQSQSVTGLGTLVGVSISATL